MARTNARWRQPSLLGPCLSRAVLAAFMLSFAGCGSPDPLEGVEVRRSNVARNQSPEVSDGRMRLLAEENRRFAYALYDRLASGDGNVALSPWSLVAALGMSLAGAAGTTDIEIRRTVGFPSEDAHLLVNATLLAFADRDGTDGIGIRTVNAVWILDGFRVRPETSERDNCSSSAAWRDPSEPST